MSQDLINEIQELLLHVSTLTELAETRSMDLFQEVKVWLKSVESSLLKNKVAAGAQISAFRGILISVEQDGLYPEGLVFHREPTKPKLRRAAAIVFMKKAVDVIYSYLLHLSVALGKSEEQ